MSGSTTPDHRALPAEQPPGTGLYVYGVARAGSVPEGLTGLDDAPVLPVEHDGLAAAVAVIALDRPPGRRAELLAHGRVVDALAEAGTVVPVQFGSILADQASVRDDFLAPNLDRFSRLLDELSGRVQLNLRASYVEDAVLAEVVAADPRIAELRERTRSLPEDAGYGDRVRLGELVARAMDRKREQDAPVILDAVLPHVAAHVERPGGEGLEHLLDLALLVDDDRRQALEEHLEGLAEAVHERIRLSLVGPVPPYDFVGGA